MSSEPTPTRRPIAGVRISTIALIGIVAAVAVPAGAAALVVSGSIDNHMRQQRLSQDGPITRVVINDSDGSVRVTGDTTMAGVSGKADLTWHSLSGTTNAKVDQHYADGVLTLTKDCGGGGCGADIDILVPPDVSVQVTTSNAGVSLTNVSGTVDVHTSNAGITAKGLGGGDATLKTSNAAIDATFAGGPKNIWAHTSNDSVKITTDGRTSYYDKVVTSNADQHLRNDSDRFSPNVIDVLTSNAPVTIN